MARRSIQIGTRGSKLALWQANWVVERLAASGVPATAVTIASHADQHPDKPLEEIGTPGVFTKELQKALLDDHIDVAVHSLKDLPTDEVKGIMLAAVPPRESPNDVLLSREGKQLNQLPPGARVGTGSLRRRAQLLHARPDLRMLDIRGNIDTRLRKLREGLFDAIVLAEAGLKRLGWSNLITQVLPETLILPAIGQGALGLETRASDHVTQQVLADLNDLASRQSVIAERVLLATLRGGCMAPIGALARVQDDGRLLLSACVLSIDGSQRLAAHSMGNAADAMPIGRQVAEQLLVQGAAELIETARKRG